jgi:hydrogenase nickel incorporation protein HypA/HybF
MIGCRKAFFSCNPVFILNFAVTRVEAMHEFSIAVNIVDIANDYASKEGAEAVREIEIEVGELSGVVLEALEFCLEVAVKDSILEGAQRNIRRVPGLARCRSCFREFPVKDLYSVCPECHAPAPEIIRGSELRVKSLLVE